MTCPIYVELKTSCLSLEPCLSTRNRSVTPVENVCTWDSRNSYTCALSCRKSRLFQTLSKLCCPVCFKKDTQCVPYTAATIWLLKRSSKKPDSSDDNSRPRDVFDGYFLLDTYLYVGRLLFAAEMINHVFCDGLRTLLDSETESTRST